MFTGIVTDQGEVLALRQDGDLRARIGTRYDVGRIDIGASISCEGICLTVVDLGTAPRNWFDVQISAETVSKTNLSGWQVGSVINLERALKVGDELGGHIVSGHVVTARVCGMKLMPNSAPSTSFTVKLVPFSAIDPLGAMNRAKASGALNRTRKLSPSGVTPTTSATPST
jgi:riboflavin synthase